MEWDSYPRPLLAYDWNLRLFDETRVIVVILKWVIFWVGFNRLLVSLDMNFTCFLNVGPNWGQILAQTDKSNLRLFLLTQNHNVFRFNKEGFFFFFL